MSSSGKGASRRERGQDDDDQHRSDGDEDGLLPEKKLAKRKRQRERKRRGDLSNAFDELALFISSEIEPSQGGPVSLSERERSPPTTRLDLVYQTIRILKRLNMENEERKRVIALIEENQRRSNQPDSSVHYGPPPSNVSPPRLSSPMYV